MDNGGGGIGEHAGSLGLSGDMRLLKHRLRGFYKRFPWNAKFETISSFLRAFIFLYYTLEGLS